MNELRLLQSDYQRAIFNRSVSECRIAMMESINRTIPSNEDEFIHAKGDLLEDQKEVERIESRINALELENWEQSLEKMNDLAKRICE